MIKLRALSIDFRVEGGIAYPSDPKLHRLAIDYAERELAKPFNFTDVKKLFVVCEINDAGEPVAIHSMGAIVFKPVVPIFRATVPEAGAVLIDRMRGYLEDQGWRGSEALIYIEPREPKEAKCPKWKQLLRLVRAEKTTHWSVTV